MSGNNCWNSVCFTCCGKADNELADVIVPELCCYDRKCSIAENGADGWQFEWGIRKRFDPAERNAGRPDRSAKSKVKPNVTWLAKNETEPESESYIEEKKLISTQQLMIQYLKHF